MKWIKIFIIALLLTSCGTRKTSVLTTDTKIEQTTTVKEEVSQVSEKIENLVDTTSIIEESFEPIDSTQPMVIDKKNGIFKNTRFKTTKTKNNIYTSKKEESVGNVKKSTLNEVSMDIQTKNKEVDRKSNLHWWLILMIIIGIILGYIQYKKR